MKIERNESTVPKCHTEKIQYERFSQQFSGFINVQQFNKLAYFNPQRTPLEIAEQLHLFPA
ncbi:hypothetical protein CRN47_01265 [Vibrio vulnificus]|nr:hypothetical protein CRN47_01265 [Vibrio vulnificus]